MMCKNFPGNLERKIEGMLLRLGGEHQLIAAHHPEPRVADIGGQEAVDVKHKHDGRGTPRVTAVAEPLFQSFIWILNASLKSFVRVSLHGSFFFFFSFFERFFGVGL